MNLGSARQFPSPIGELIMLCSGGERMSKFSNVSKLARKYLAIHVSSAPSERVFSQLKLIVERKRWRVDPARIESVLFLRCNIRL